MCSRIISTCLFNRTAFSKCVRPTGRRGQKWKKKLKCPIGFIIMLNLEKQFLDYTWAMTSGIMYKTSTHRWPFTAASVDVCPQVQGACTTCVWSWVHWEKKVVDCYMQYKKLVGHFEANLEFIFFTSTAACCTHVCLEKDCSFNLLPCWHVSYQKSEVICSNQSGG